MLEGTCKGCTPKLLRTLIILSASLSAEPKMTNADLCSFNLTICIDRSPRLFLISSWSLFSIMKVAA